MSDALQQFLDSVRDEPFQWGRHDCSMFAARATDARCGTIYAARVVALGATSPLAYRRILRGRTLESAARKILGQPSIGKPGRGDVALVAADGKESLGIAVPPVILLADKVGFLPVPMAACVAFWRIG